MDKPALLELFRNVYQCRICTGREDYPIMNPYLNHNCKHDPPDANHYHIHRRQFLEEYLDHLDDNASVMIVGEAPGLDGCGYCGVAFTGEHNAIVDQGLANYHNARQGHYQEEASASRMYEAMRMAAGQLGVEFDILLRHVFLTNACLCVPLKPKNSRSVRNTDDVMEANCRNTFFQEQVRLANPSLIVAIGARSLKAVGLAFNFAPDPLKYIVENGVIYEDTDRGIQITAEIHPSPRNRNNRHVGHLWPGIPDRLAQHLARALQHLRLQ